MAKNTKKGYRNQVMYSVYVRNHSEEGTFEGVRRDLERIKSLGVDIIWLMPIHPIGIKGHKGTLGCPYAIRDYREVNPEYGTLEDFKRLTEEIHRLDMKCVIDVVYNHTSPDSRLAENHLEWFFRKEDGQLGSKGGDWSDVADLDYAHPELWDYQIETLKQWAAIVDGFRCDVASVVPLDFWIRAREEVEQVRPGCLWLAESVHPAFIRSCRAEGYCAFSDCEMYQAFDITYDYDIFPLFQEYLEGKIPLGRYVEAINQQEYIYPDNYVKLRFLENHDQLRAAFVIPDEASRRNWTAFLYFQRGMTLLYGGQEAGCVHLPSLFDKDTVDFSGEGFGELYHRLYEIKQDVLFAEGAYQVQAMDGDVVFASYSGKGRRIAGLFGLKGRSALLDVPIPDGRYRNLIDDTAVEVQMGRFSFAGRPVIFEVNSYA